MVSAAPTLPKKVLPLIFQALRTVPRRVQILNFISVLASAAAISNTVYIMYNFKQLVDILSSTPGNMMWSAASGLFFTIVFCFILHGILHRIRHVSDFHSTPEIENKLREIMTDYLLKHSLTYFNNRFAGTLVTKIKNVGAGYAGLLRQVLHHGFIPTFFASTASSILLWSINPRLVFVLWAVIAGLIVMVYFLASPVSRAVAQLARRDSEITGQLIDTVSNISSVKSFTQTPLELALLNNVQVQYVQDNRHLTWKEAMLWGTYDFLIAALVVGFIWQIIDGWERYNLTAGSVTACMVIMWDLWYRFSSFSGVLSRLSNEWAKIQEAIDEIVQPLEIMDQPGAADLHVTQGNITFKDVAFSYIPQVPVFESLNLTIPARQRVGLVGLSGAGKTTLCQLLVRNYDVHGGEILIDGQNIPAVTQESLRQAVAVIPQDPSLFHRTLKENISYGSPQASHEQIIAASKAAQAHEFIMSLPQQYDTLVGERGVKLSGGQRQRIVIARAILKNAPILLLDEATSSLDSQTERAIQAAFHTAMEGRTTIVIAHRLSTLAHLDRILVMSGGRIVEDGNLSELLAKEDHFAKLWRLQADGFLPESL